MLDLGPAERFGNGSSVTCSDAMRTHCGRMSRVKFAGDLPAMVRVAFAKAIREGYAADAKGTGCPYGVGAAECVAWRYGLAWAARKREHRQPLPAHVRPPVEPEPPVQAADRRPRPRVVYRHAGTLRVAVGRRGEPVESLAAEIAWAYPSGEPAKLPVSLNRLRYLADYVAGRSSAQEAAKSMGIRKARLLDLSRSQTLVAAAAAMHPMVHDELWDGHCGWSGEAVLVYSDAAVVEGAPTPRLDADMEAHKVSGHGIGRTERTGRVTTRGKPILRRIGVEASYRGHELRITPALPIRWRQEQLTPGTYRADWGTPAVKETSVAKKLAKPKMQAPVLTLHGADAEAHCLAHPSQPGLALPALASTVNEGQQMLKSGTGEAPCRHIGWEGHQQAQAASRAKRMRRRAKARTVLAGEVGWEFAVGPEFEFDDLPLAA